MTPTYTNTMRLEALRAVGVWLTVGGSVALFFLGGQLFVRDDPSWAYINVLVLGVGVTVLQWSRARLKRRWVENRPYLLSADGTVVLRGRREISLVSVRSNHGQVKVWIDRDEDDGD